MSEIDSPQHIKSVEDRITEAIAAEREACARELENIAWSAPTADGEWAMRQVARYGAAAIRARGEK